MIKVAVVDYGMGNLDSVRRALEECGARVTVTDAPADLALADRIILPGVGSFRDGMANLRARSLDKALEDEVLGHSVPLLGLCLGMQLLAAEGFEGGRTPGLDWIDAEVRRLVPSAGERIPHIGWNEVHPARSFALLDEIPAATDFYFVHSYHVVCRDTTDAVATTPYCDGFTSVIERGTVAGVQFHPEKSQRWGLQLLRNFLRG